MKDSVCYIIGAGSFGTRGLSPLPGDLVIAADGGYEHLHSMGIKPDVLLGDFDSIKMLPEHLPIIRHPVMKDATDTALAAEYGSNKGYETFMIYGGTGGRIDHTLANIQLMSNLAGRGARCYLIGDGYAAAAVCDGALAFDERYSGTVSVFCAGQSAAGVCLDGLKYPLCGATLTYDTALGVSNEFTGSKATVAVSAGTLTVFWFGNEELALPAYIREESK